MEMDGFGDQPKLARRSVADSSDTSSCQSHQLKIDDIGQFFYKNEPLKQ